MTENSVETMTRREFAELIGRTPQAVSQWIQAGMPARHAGRRGRQIAISVEDALPWVLRHITAPLPERERLASERADQIALQNEAARAGLVYTYQLRQAIGRLFDAFDECAQLPADLAERIAGSDDPATIRAMLLDWTRGLRSRYADAVATAADGLA